MSTLTAAHVEQLRTQFPALARQQAGHPAIFFDGPAGTQVPQTVIDAIGHYLTHCNANHGGAFQTSRQSDAILDAAHQAAADLLGARDADCVSFGANMTTLTFALSRALARTWSPGDEIVLSRLEHDANYTPWVMAAQDAGVKIHYIDIDPADCTLRMEQYASVLNDRTKLVAVGCASNAVGTINEVQQICSWARQVGAFSFLDAVHYSPHALCDVEAWGCDFLVCSAYKFFGPHVGIMYGRRELLESLTAYKLRTSPRELPGKWMTGTQNHECIAGTLAAIDYLASIGTLVGAHEQDSRRIKLTHAFEAIRRYELQLLNLLLDGLLENSQIRVWGITDPSQRHRRLPTVSINHSSMRPAELASYLDQQGVYAWHGNYYALPLTERIGVEPEGMVRIGLAHYNTQQEVERLLQLLAVPAISH